MRATFRLAKELIEVLGPLAGHFRVKRKSLFDQLVEDEVMLGEVADSIVSMSKEDGGQRHPTTFVVSRRFLQVVQQAVNARCVPRDILVEALIRRLLPLLFNAGERRSQRVDIDGAVEGHHQHWHKVFEQNKKIPQENRSGDKDERRSDSSR